MYIIAYNFSRFAIYLPKFITFYGNLTSYDRNKNAQFFGTRCRMIGLPNGEKTMTLRSAVFI